MGQEQMMVQPMTESSGYMITNIPGGSYSITVTDNNNCSQSTSVVSSGKPVARMNIQGRTAFVRFLWDTFIQVHQG